MKFSPLTFIGVCAAALLVPASLVAADSSLPSCLCNIRSSSRELSNLNPFTACFCSQETRSFETDVVDCCGILFLIPTIIERIILILQGRDPLNFRTVSRSLSAEELPEPGSVHHLGMEPGQKQSVQVRPDETPNHPEGLDYSLVSDDIGLYLYPEFVTSDEVQDILNAIEDSQDSVWDCYEDHCRARPGLDSCKEKTHPSRVQPEGKECLLITSPVMKKLDEQKKAVWKSLEGRFRDLWPQYNYTSPFFVQSQEGESESFLAHIDGQTLNTKMGYLSPVTTILYLTDGGNEIVFPNANNGHGVAITPKAGMAITWFNIDKNDDVFGLSAHGVMPGYEDTPRRTTVSNKYTYAPDLHAGYDLVHPEEFPSNNQAIA